MKHPLVRSIKILPYSNPNKKLFLNFSAKYFLNGIEDLSFYPYFSEYFVCNV